METKEKEVKSVGALVSGATIKELGKNLPMVTKKAMELPQTIKTVEALFKKIQHRDRLEAYSQKLKDFTIEKKEEDLEASHYYSGCRLEIADDNNQKFLLKHPIVILEVIEFMTGRFEARLKEVESEIKLPIAV